MNFLYKLKLLTVFRYTIEAGDVDLDGIGIGTLVANGGTLLNAVLNSASLTLNNVGSTIAVLVDSSLSIDSNENRSKFSMYPNPSSETVKIKSNLGGNFYVINPLGQAVIAFKVNPNVEAKVYIGDLSEGVYFVKAIDNTNASSKKLVVKK
ncbi:T9SS type A sorting domain-containing protein [Mariniflexile litorale]|uniref:T9SS type A sorting domain-containing protein n=1 Tax=Mariniflexile litorale TaxID=3045158 RepID=A0AAU7EEN5_9FLAO|nr:T9SS type A sorting domain-containing protein [Mariniflexile sp. KMM 9835]MDQ8211441.1 T9SS type A sorting domain-containing protein [Mariniflexile sp. KMM 9835]